MENLDFVALDLETATWDRSSICEIGIAIVKKSTISARHSWLIKPPFNYYDSFNIGIHGITPAMTEKSPEFFEAWKIVEPHLSGKIIVAHNVSFDMYALRDAFVNHNVDFPNFDFVCSYRAATRIIKGLNSYKLPFLCDYFNINIENYHRAGDDAAACAKLFIKLMEHANANSIHDLEKRCGLNRGTFAPMSFRSCLTNKKYNTPVKAKDIVGNSEFADPDSILFGKRVCLTGALTNLTRQTAQQIIADIGGIPVDSVTSKTDVLIVGQQDFRAVGESGMSSKQRKAIDLSSKGKPIVILSEEDFLQNIVVKYKYGN
jgi:DNA polymerase-3 subunit epsilon